MAPNDYYDDDDEVESEEDEVVAAPKKRTKKWKVSRNDGLFDRFNMIGRERQTSPPATEMTFIVI